MPGLVPAEVDYVLDETLGSIHGIGGKADQQVGRLQQVEPAMHGGLGQRHLAP
jgi:hypothetical protein